MVGGDRCHAPSNGVANPELRGSVVFNYVSGSVHRGNQPGQLTIHELSSTYSSIVKTICQLLTPLSLAGGTSVAFHDFMQDFIDFLLGRGDEEGPAEEGLNPLDTAAAAIGGGQSPATQQPIIINLAAPKQLKRIDRRSVNQDATLEALALSRSAQTPSPSGGGALETGSRDRNARKRIQDKDVRRRVGARASRSGGARAN